ncbi:sister chromatid cohesion protein Dcc1 [Aspergillus karnatakaensis]|uniref:putative sister chromatid cohesion protein Dcc1 n=1 Tax=Aspergillus karnatakaensis TaxID=1810916 RepID=UPI003CCC9B28
MSTQSTPSILFTHRSHQQGFRLLELPPELAELLSSENPPTLQLKSPSPGAPKTTATAPAADYVNLCTPTATYSIRQVQSSNSLHILKPSSGVAVRKDDLAIVGEDGDGDVDMGMEQLPNLNVEGTVTSIAKCGSTLELHKPAEGFSAEPFLAALLDVFEKGVEDSDHDAADGLSATEAATIKRETLERVFADIPVSRAECERGWVEICAFVIPDNGLDSKSACWRPSAEMKLDVWKRLMEGSVLQGIDLKQQFLVRDLWRSVLDDDGLAPFPRPLFEAVVRRIREIDGKDPGALEAGMKWASIDKEACVRWVGEVYLQVTAPGPATATGESEFLSAWKDLLPESWREDVSVSTLPKCYMHPDPKTICFATEADQQKAKKNLPTDTSAATAAKKTRNWHELFKNQKKQKR